jgi:GT2 family glycosyltransferase
VDADLAPRLSIVIATHNAREVICDCLAALQAQAGREKPEIIVADSSTDSTDRLVREQFPDVCLSHYPEAFTIPQLRGAGIAAAHGELIAILDPYCIADEHWIEALVKAHAERPEVAIGGCVQIDDAAGRSLTRWATYFNEYADFIPPVAAGQTSVLTGNNIAYKRSALGDVEELRQKGFWKAFANEQLLATGHPLWTEPALVVRLRKSISFREFLTSRYHHGRCYAAMRIAGASPMVRLVRVLSTPLLPFLFLWRQVRSVWPKRQCRKNLFLTLPFSFLFSCSWTWGELGGYLGGPGRSCNCLYF